MKKITMSAALLIVGALAATPEMASATTVRFSGTVTQTIGSLASQDYLAIGTPVSGSFTYTTKPLKNISNLPFQGIYDDRSATSGIVLNLPNGVVSTNPSVPNAYLRLGLSDNHQYYPQTPDTFGAYQDVFGINRGVHSPIYGVSIGMELAYLNPGLKVPLAINTPDLVSGMWSIRFTNGSSLVGSITQISTVPIPSAAVLFASAFGVLAGIRRRRARGI